jgi:endonuclease G
VKKIILLPLLVLCSIIVRSQDTIRLKHKNYEAVFSKSLKYPVLVEWWVTRAKVTCTNPVPRKDAFKPDPLLPKETDLIESYKGSGLDRGHNAPAADNQCDGELIQAECFYFSNMTPQYHSLNAGDWKALEMLTREWAAKDDSIKVWCGSIGEDKKIGIVSVPKQCWKVLYFKKNGEWMAFLFENTKDKPTGLKSHEVDLNIITKLTGYKFK